MPSIILRGCLGLLLAVIAGTALPRIASAQAVPDEAEVLIGLNHREGPGPEYRVIQVLPAGATVTVLVCEGLWCRVSYSDRTGWAFREHLRLLEPPPGPADTPGPPTPTASDAPGTPEAPVPAPATGAAPAVPAPPAAPGPTTAPAAGVPEPTLAAPAPAQPAPAGPATTPEAGAIATIPAITTAALNLRPLPTTAATAIRLLPVETPLTVSRCTRNYLWCEVALGEETGWVYAAYIAPAAGGPPLAEGGEALGVPVVDIALPEPQTAPVAENPLRRAGAGEVCFYADPDFAGAMICASAGQFDTALGAVWNNRISSVEVGAGAAVEVCGDFDYGGWCTRISADARQLAGPRNDAISSYRVS